MARKNTVVLPSEGNQRVMNKDNVPWQVEINDLWPIYFVNERERDGYIKWAMRRIEYDKYNPFAIIRDVLFRNRHTADDVLRFYPIEDFRIEEIYPWFDRIKYDITEGIKTGNLPVEFNVPVWNIRIIYKIHAD